MPLVNVKLIEGVFTDAQKTEMVKSIPTAPPPDAVLGAVTFGRPIDDPPPEAPGEQ
jgi:hypothetical protein